MYLNVNKAYSSFNSNLAKEEKNDCFVRALAVASGSSYSDAHQMAKEKFGREDKKGTQGLMIATQMLKMEDDGLEIGGKKLKVSILGKSRIKNKYKLKGDVIWRKKTLKSFIQSNPKGSYIVTVANHALGVKDGEVLDWGSNKFLPTRKVQAAYEVETSKPTSNQLTLF